jgi:hypothetical protein
LILLGLGSRSEATAGLRKNDVNLQRNVRREVALQAA